MTVESDAFTELEPAVRGRVVRPADPDYDEARRVWNGMIDKRPRLVVQAADEGDVAPTIELARRHGLALAIRGGGHNVAGSGTVDDGIVLDLHALNAVEVDPATRVVRIAAGATLGDIDRATEPFGLAVPIGVVSGTGIAGLTLGGGVGWLTRAHGLTIDNLVAAEVILATGERVRASETEHPDLFWGLRGGGGNFGVVTSLTLRAYPLGPSVFAGSLIYRLARWRDALRAYAEWTATLPDELTTLVTFMVPPADWEIGDAPLMFMGYAWAGVDHADGRRLVDAMTALCPPDIALTEPTPWLTFQSGFDSAMPKGVRAWWRNAWFAGLTDEVIETLVEHCGAQSWVGTAADLHHMGGAFGRVDEDATAFPSRAAAYWLNIYGFWSDPDDDRDRTAWVKGLSDATRPLAMPGQYVNFLGRDEDPSRAQALAVYGERKLERLVAVKRRYDPENVFRINHNIRPDGWG